VEPTKPDPAWREAIYRVLKELEFRQIVFVPDAGHAHLIERCLADPEIKAGPLTNEFEGIGVCVGAWLGGEKAALLIQGSGVGNLVNALGLVRSTGSPFLMVVTMRGEWGEFNPWQLAMGQAAPAVLEAAGVIVNRVDRAEEVEAAVRASAQLAFSSYCPVAVLISQRVTGAKVFK
jgi:sulfopyruvate decarboxylase TPP-binding subunit